MFLPLVTIVMFLFNCQGDFGTNFEMLQKRKSELGAFPLLFWGE